MTNKSLMEFPCDFQIKVIGVNNDTFLLEMIQITRKHFPKTDDQAIRTQPSQQGNYLSLTITLYVEDQMTLDALYIELTAHPDTKMVL